MGLVQFSFYNIASGLVRPDGFFPAESDACILFRPARRSLGHRPVSEKQWIRGLFCHPDSGLSALSSVRAVRRIGSLWHSLRQFSLKPSGVQCPALPHCDHRRWHRHTARRRDSLPDAQTPPIAGRCLCAFGACVGHPARAAFYARRNFCLFLFTDAYEWLEVFAVIPMLCYNGTRGHGSKKLSHWFYPTHIYVLYALSFLLYLTLYGMGS